MSQIYPKGFVMTNRTTGLPEGPAIRLTKQDYFCKYVRLETKVWRYMRRYKFADLLERRALYFRRSDLMRNVNDPRENTDPPANRQFKTKAWRLFQNYWTIEDRPLEERTEAFQYCSFINCWNISKGECERMWREYCKDKAGQPDPESVVITSTVRQIVTPLKKWGKCFSGGVRYESPDVVCPEWSYLAPLFFKPPAFYYEAEYRLVAFKDEVSINSEQGILVPYEPAALVNEVFLNPSASASFRSSVVDMLRTHGIKAAVHCSRLRRI